MNNQSSALRQSIPADDGAMASDETVAVGAMDMQIDLVMAELDRVTGSQAFRFADRQRGFLRYVVTEAVHRRAERLKEYVIGVEVFCRPTSFDPRLDSIVRTEAHKLRAKLARYYETEGRANPMRIELPKGKYAPVFVNPIAQDPDADSIPSRPQCADRLRLLVLPFEDRTTSGIGDNFSDDLTDELSHALASLPGVEVVARRCAVQFKGRAVDICEVGKQLEVDAVIEGSVRRVGDRLRILVQADDPANGCALWSQSYECRAENATGLQQDIAQSIAHQLLPAPHRSRPSTFPRVARGPAAGPDVRREAHAHYLQGLRYIARHTPEDMAEASRLFNLAVEKDVRMARGYTHLAYSYLMRAALQTVVPAELVSRACLAASKALSIDPTAGAAHITLALQRIQNYEWRLAGEEFREGLRLSPSDALGHAWYGIYLASFGSAPEAIKAHERALELDADAAMSSWSYGLTLFLLRRFSEATRYFLRTLARHPDSLQAHIGLAVVALQKGNRAGAIAALEQLPASTATSWHARAKLGYAYAVAGNIDRARELLNELRQLADRGMVPSQGIAEIHIGLGEQEQAFQWLHRCIDQNDTPPILRCDPVFDPLRADHRFPGLLAHARML
jgi:serine/threonine-protein kinase